METLLPFKLSTYFPIRSTPRIKSNGRISCSTTSEDSTVNIDNKNLNGTAAVKIITGGSGHIPSVERQKKSKIESLVQLEVLWDDGFGSESMKDYLDICKELVKPDGGPPRWFCPIECGCPLQGSPLLLFLPGIDGVGLGLIMHHKPLGKVFEVRCLHIPINDRTSFEGLVEFVEKTVRQEHASSPEKPIYLVGDSFGCCLALTVAARNPSIDLVLILANPATSLEKSQIRLLFPILETMPDGLHSAVPYLLSFVMSEPVKMAMYNVDKKLPPGPMVQQVSENLTALLPRLSVISDMIPKDTLIWKFKLLRSAAAYTNSRLHSVKAEVLVLASGKDNMFPTEDEAKRLSSVLKDCKVRIFKENGHSLLLEDGINLLTVIKGTSKYRRSRKYDYVTEFVPPSMSEYIVTHDQVFGLFHYYSSPTMFSTLEDGTIVQGLVGVPNEGPVLLVGNHMLMGMDIPALLCEFLREKKIMVRGLGHPELFTQSFSEFSFVDYLRVAGVTPVTPRNFFKLLSTNAHILLFPGGIREALHRKGEKYNLIWPDRQEFVRMAAKFGATIVPFGSIGEDDIAELVLDYNDLMRIPVLNENIQKNTREMRRARPGFEGEVAEEDLYIPGVIPKVPGRIYYLFGRPIETRGRKELVTDKDLAHELYLDVKSEVESSMAYLLKKREDDPYRSIINRAFYRLFSSPIYDVPTFSP